MHAFLTIFAKGKCDWDWRLEITFTYPFLVGLMTLKGKGAEFRAANAWRKSKGAQPNLYDLLFGQRWDPTLKGQRVQLGHLNEDCKTQVTDHVECHLVTDSSFSFQGYFRSSLLAFFALHSQTVKTCIEHHFSQTFNRRRKTYEITMFFTDEQKLKQRSLSSMTLPKSIDVYSSH